jgi:hypothetical protein
VKGYEKSWYAWPLLRQARWIDEGVERSRSQFLYFVFWHEQQRLAARPAAAPASLTHLWPLFSQWDNGAGRYQWQLLSPFEVFFPDNAKVRQTWSPFFALARYDQQAPGQTRTSLLWNAVTWSRTADEDRTEFHFGPLVGVTRAGAERRVAIGNGLLGFHRTAAGNWRAFWLEFSRRPSAGSGNP